MNKSDFFSLIKQAFEKEIIKKLIFSRPNSSEINKISCRLCSHRGKRLLAMEYYLPGNTVSQKNLKEEELQSELLPLIDGYRQINLLTTLGNAEYKLSKSGSCVVLGGDTLCRKLSGLSVGFETSLLPLDRKKNYILTGNEDFLIKLGISSSDGRVHDKRQGKFRQINKFLEHIEELYQRLPADDQIKIYDLCSGKSYLSFAVYYYLTVIKRRDIYMLCVDLKRDVILWCEALASELKFSGMHFIVGDILTLKEIDKPNLVISLHACDIATDIVIDTAIRLDADIILSTPCCHKYLNDKINTKLLSFVTDYPHLRNKLCEAITDALRLSRLSAAGYSVSACELTDPENTPKNTLLRAVKNPKLKEEETAKQKNEYERQLEFILGDNTESYLKEIK